MNALERLQVAGQSIWLDARRRSTDFIGLDRGFRLMVGSEAEAVPRLEPIFDQKRGRA